MELRNKKIIHFAQYSAPYEGNFILSLRMLEKVLLQNYKCKMVYVFPENAKYQHWMNTFLLYHTVYFTLDDLHQSIPAIIDIFKKEIPDLVHTHFDGYDIPVMKSKEIYLSEFKKYDLKIVWHLHNHLSYHNNWIKKIYQLYYFWNHYNRYAKNVSIIAVSDEVSDFVSRFKKEGFFLIETIFNGIDLERLIPLDLMPYKAPDIYTFLAFGGRNIQKRIDLLLQAGTILDIENKLFRICITKGIDTECVVNNFFEGKGYPKWLTLVDQTDRIADIFSVSSCFVSTSSHETFSYAIAEASIFGLPVIQSDIKGTQWNAENPSCFSFKSLQVDDLVKSMKKVMSVPPVTMHEYCCVTRKKNISRYTISVWCKNIVRYYKEIK